MYHAFYSLTQYEIIERISKKDIYYKLYNSNKIVKVSEVTKVIGFIDEKGNYSCLDDKIKNELLIKKKKDYFIDMKYLGIVDKYINKYDIFRYSR